MTTNLAEMAGEIRVRLTQLEDRIAQVEIVSTRPVAAARIFEGKPVTDMCATIGRVFSLCGTAQTVAALAAAEAALATPADPAVDAARSAARQAEMLTQLLTRLALHWPRVLGLPLAPEAVRAAMAVERAIEAQVLGPDWRRPGGGALAAGTGGLVAEIDVPAITGPLREALAVRGLEGYGALPDGRAAEPGVLTTHWEAGAVARARAVHGTGLAARLAAAEAALIALPEAIRADLAATAARPPRSAMRDSGQGAATVETARGPLTHRVEIRDGLVTRCRTEAPTEPNFAENGPVAAGLAGAAPDPVAAELHVLAIDPCVACRLDLAPG